VHTFTGTPITNTLTEIYNQMRYVMDDQMERDGVKDWDSWFNTFAELETDVELTATGEYEPSRGSPPFVNVAELRRMAGQYLDIVFRRRHAGVQAARDRLGQDLSDDLTESERAELENGRTEKPIGRPYKKVINDVAPMAAQPARRPAASDRARAGASRTLQEGAPRMMLGGHPSRPSSSRPTPRTPASMCGSTIPTADDPRTRSTGRQEHPEALQRAPACHPGRVRRARLHRLRLPGRRQGRGRQQEARQGRRSTSSQD
jgi:hypothetical protein